ncbi:MAG: PAS domain S-box protein [Phycisphaerales bacterium]|nr:MAG: PAS domain S-box protein [Phycisphaerales bacterium]
MGAAEATHDELHRELETVRARLAELERAEAERKPSEDVLLLAQFTVDHGAMPTFWIGPDARILHVNDAACRSLGYSRQELTSMAVYDFDPNFPREKWPGHWRDLKRHSSMSFESHHRNKSGRIFPVEIFANYLEFKGREYNVGFARDITERKQIEKTLRESEERFRQIANTIEDVCWITDWSDQRTLFASPAYEKIWGRSVQGLYEDPKDWANAIHPDDRQRAWDALVHLDETGSYDEEYRIVRPDGSVRWIRDRGFPVRDESGQVYRVAGIAQDITERKRANDVLRAADRLAAMGTVVAGVAHEINTPLTTICGLAELLAKDKSLRGKAREAADDIVQQAIRCNRIVEDLLGFARAGRVSSRPVQVNVLIKRCLALFRRTHRFDDVEIIEDYDADIPDTMADPYRLEQVFINIIRNAGDILTANASVKRLTVRSRRSGEQIRVEFVDTGPGIADPHKVFDPFYTTRVTAEGTGLGLSVSLGIIRDHGGTLTAENTGDGARFIITLPVRPVSPEQVPTSG